MSRILYDLNELVRACYPQSQEEALELWHDIRPKRFSGRATWTIAQEYSLAGFAIPDDAAYLVVTRVDCYVTTIVATAAGFGLKAPPPTTGTFNTRWTAEPNIGGAFPPAAQFNVTGETRPFSMVDVDELLFFRSGEFIQLVADLPANPTADARFLHTVVYSYLLGPKVADKLGSGEVLIR